MKACVLTLLMTLNCCSVLHAQSNETTQNDLRLSTTPCVALEIFADYEDKRHVDEALGCELQGDDLNGRQYRMVRINGLTSSWARSQNVTSGATTIYVPGGAFIDDHTSELVVPSAARVKIGRRKKLGSLRGSASRHANVMDRTSMSGNRRLLSTGRRTVIVIRIVAIDSATTASEAQLSDDIFGTSGDGLNLKSGYNFCSYGQLQFEPLSTNERVGADGVYTVYLRNTYVVGSSSGKVYDAALAQVTADLGKSPNLLADHVMFCIPPGTTGGWIAYAAPNHWMSVYNDKWCQYPSSGMHELGHNLNLHHSGEGNDEYNDQSGLMGYSYGSDDTPNMCFNGAKTWQLGWHSDFHLDLPVGNDFNWIGNLVGFAERSSASPSDRMIIRIRSTSKDFYIHFNRKIGMNSGTLEGGNQVHVSTRSPGTGLAVSYLLAKVSGGGMFTIPNFNGSGKELSVVVSSISLGTVPARATVSIQFALPPPPTTGSDRSSPTTKAPTAKKKRKRFH
ncbi:Gametolysin peptidase M11 [Fragilaria crotonensis]|nr:Gametolysin peptidase M11 [Fragilaria crotonensis]